MIDMKVDDLIAMLEPYRGKEVYIKCAYHNLDIKEVKVERYSHAGDYTHKVYERGEIIEKLSKFFDGVSIIDGQCRIDSITFVFTTVHIEERPK